MKELRTQIWSPLFLYQRKGGKKKNNFLLNPLWIHLQCVHMCSHVCVCEWDNLPHRIANIEGSRFYFFSFFLLDLFSNVDVYHLSGPAIHHPPLFLSIIRKGVNLLKCESLFFFFLNKFICTASPPPLAHSISVFLSVFLSCGSSGERRQRSTEWL